MIAHHEPSTHSKFNLLFIITDQQRADAIGYVNPLVKTPHINYLASRSVFCRNAFVQSPQCQPSRASILTGRYPTAHRVWWNETAVPTTEQTIGNYLARAGYYTGYFGKLHFDGNGSHSDVARYFGFQKSFLFEDWQQWVTAKHLSQKGASPVEMEFYGPMSRPTWTGEFAHRATHHEEVVTERAIEFMKTSAEPWCAMVGFHGPHPPYAAPSEFSSQYALDDMSVPSMPVLTYAGHRMSPDEWRQLKRQYYGSISWIDECVGKLTAAAGLKTVVVFTSDHGDILGDHGYFSKGLFAYDGNIKVPLIIRIPGFGHRDYEHLVQSIDVLPTVFRTLGVPIPRGVQGVDLTHGFNTNQPVNDLVMSMIGYSPRLRMIRTHSHKYWIYGNEEFVFDLVADPGENVNLFPGSPTAAMRFQLLQALIRSEDPLPSPRLP